MSKYALLYALQANAETFTVRVNIPYLLWVPVEVSSFSNEHFAGVLNGLCVCSNKALMASSVAIKGWLIKSSDCIAYFSASHSGLVETVDIFKLPSGIPTPILKHLCLLNKQISLSLRLHSLIPLRSSMSAVRRQRGPYIE
ncbi:hypothetical protein GQX74_001007 [Glossina fuscipes]|nr:hypothetical protein GQX74_001007 [Glossina fuscipes]